MPTHAQFEEDPELTAIAVAYSNPNYTLIADRVAPRKPVSSRSFKYDEYDLADNFTVPDTRVGRRSAPNMLEIDGETKSAGTEEFGLDIPLDNTTVDEARKRGRDLRKQATERSTNLMLLDREIRTAGIVFKPDTYHADDHQQLSGTSKFTDKSQSAPIDVIVNRLDSCIVRPNKLVFGQAAWTATSMHPDVVKAVHGNAGDKGKATRQQVAELFEVQEVLVGAGRLNVNKPGQAPALARVWGGHVAGLFIDETADFETGGVTFMLTAQYGERVGGAIPVDMGLRGGIKVRAGEEVMETVIAQRAGFMIEDAA